MAVLQVDQVNSLKDHMDFFYHVIDLYNHFKFIPGETIVDWEARNSIIGEDSRFLCHCVHTKVTIISRNYARIRSSDLPSADPYIQSDSPSMRNIALPTEVTRPTMCASRKPRNAYFYERILGLHTAFTATRLKLKTATSSKKNYFRKYRQQP